MVKQLQEEAKALTPTLSSDLAKAFASATSALPPIEPRGSLFINTLTRAALTKQEVDALPSEEREALQKANSLRERTIDEAFYYTTRYGTPLAYARPLDILAAHGFAGAEGKRILDYGYGTIGHLRLLASLGAECWGVETDPLLEKMYAQRGDIGLIARIDPARRAERSSAGAIRLLTGQWPADQALLAMTRTAGVKGSPAGGAGLYDLFISKNTLKRGYVHPDAARTAGLDSRRLVNLGVGDEMFVREVFNTLRPGGMFLIYNICPAPAPDDKPYIPWADGRCPFARETLEKTGFEVIAFDENDDEAVRQMATALGWDKAEEGQPGMDLVRDLFASWTLARRPASK